MLCDSQTFDVLDGLYFCTQCGTQSEDVREEGFFVENVDIRLRLEKKGRRKKAAVDCGKPWFTLEGFQLLIKAQVEFLVQKGFNAKLKDVVGQMWFRYVQLSSVAFKTTGESGAKVQECIELQKKRDIKVSNQLADSLNCSGKTTKKKKDKETMENMENIELSSDIAREDFYEDDNPNRGLFDSEDENLDEDEDEEDSDSDSSIIGSIFCDAHTSTRSAGYMSMGKSLSFCYLGLLWLREPISLSDLIRWAREGHLPYFEASSLLPSYMKFSLSDVSMFGGRVLPNKRQLYCSASALKTYIRIPSLPEQSIELYIARYLIDLQLPACMHRCVYAILKMLMMDHSKFGHLPCYDDLAMAYIILTLKLIYGLDGKTECELAKLAEDIPLDAEHGSYFPTWCDLLQVVRASLDAPVRHGVPWTIEELGLLKDCRNYSQFSREKIFTLWEPPITLERDSKGRTGRKGLNPDKQEEYAGMFGRFLDKEGQREMPGNLKEPSSFPLLCGKREWTKNRAGDEVATRVEQHSESVSDGSRRNRGSDAEATAEDSHVFTNGQGERDSSSRTTSDPFKQAKRRGLSWETISNYHQGAREDEESVQSDSRPKAKKRPRRSCGKDTAPSKCGTRFVCYNLPCSSYKVNMSFIYWEQFWKDAILPDSLKHLVELCSKIVETETSVLFYTVQELERKLFS